MNNICFCFPLPFFPFPDPSPSPSSSPALAVSAAPALTTAPALPARHAGAAGVESPRIFFSDTFPLTGAFCRAVLDAGSSGNSALDNFGGAGRTPDPELEPEPLVRESGRDITAGLGTEDGARTPDAELAAHGVLRGGWRKPCTGTGPGVGAIGGWRGGKRSGGRGAGAWIGADDDDEPAAWATRSHTCLEDCWEEREPVECLALRTRPVVMPA